MDIKQLILEELLLESVADNTIRKAMDEKKAIFFSYDNAGRTVDVYAIGTTKAGNPALFGWLRNVSSSNSINNPSKNPKRRAKDLIRWRLFRLDKIPKVFITKLPYIEDVQRTNKEKQDYSDLVRAKSVFNQSQSGILSQQKTLPLNV